MRQTLTAVLLLACGVGVAQTDDDLGLVSFAFEDFASDIDVDSTEFETTELLDARQVAFTGWSYDVEATFSEIRGSYGDFDDRVVGTRITVGKEDSSGAGLRGRLWLLGGELDQSTYRYNFFTGRGGRVTTPADLAVGTLNLDYYQRIWAGRTSFVFSIGPQLGAVRYDDIYGARDMAALGFGAGVEMRREIVRSDYGELALLGHARLGFMRSDDGAFDTTDYGIGVEWRRQYTNGDLFVRGGFGAQWLSPDASGVLDLTTASFSVGYQW